MATRQPETDIGASRELLPASPTWTEARSALGGTRVHGGHGVSPSPDQELLLRAVFAPTAGPGRQWIERTDLDRVDPGSFQLLPQLYRNLTAVGGTGPGMERLRGVYRYAWSANAVALRDARLLLESLGEAGAPARLIGPAAFVHRYYGDLGARLIDCLHLLVRPRDLCGVLAALRQAGAMPAEPVAVDRLLAAGSSTPVTIHGRVVVLHWSLLGARGAEGDDQWPDAEPVNLDGISVNAVSSADDLLFVLLRATRWEPVPPFRWLADAMAIVQSRQGDLDWDRLLYQARAHRVVLPVRQALGYLSHRLGQPIPAPVLTAAESLSISLAERMAYRVRRRPPALFGRLPDLLFRYLDQSRGVSPLLRMSGVVGWLQRVWGLPSPRKVPAYVVRRAWARARETSAGRSHFAHRLNARR